MANRLIQAKSPYLLQHAHNPVDWYPWGDEAFTAARERDVPIFLSIGYATCHWCHVMERESFEDDEVAELMNAAFVNIKVDREERPDIDALYMTVAQMLVGRAGWPLTIVMLPDRRPFYAATYIPKGSRYGVVGMLDLIPKIQMLWAEGRDRAVQSAGRIASELERLETEHQEAAQLGPSTSAEAFRALSASHDRQHGGFGRAPKFPTPHQLLFLLRHWRRSGDSVAWDIVERTLSAMRRGGIFDHVGFGFHRYSTDAEWLVPHFEKMLYDQSLLMLAYAEAAAASGREEFARVAREVVTYVLRDLTSDDGAFFSAEDADSEGVEGKFYVWTVAEVEAVLGHADAAFATRAWGLKPEGNFHDEATGEMTGANILHHPGDVDQLERGVDLSGEDGHARLESLRRKLLDVRRERIRPLLDDKVLTDWNGLMIAALARTGSLIRDPECIAAAQQAERWVWRHMWRDEHLLHRYRDGDADIDAMLDDYAFLAWGEVELYQATLDAEHLARAIQLTDKMLKRFWDGERGGLYLSPADRTDLLVRQRDVYDGALPSGNSVAFYNLARLFRLTGNAAYDQRAAQLADAFSRAVAGQPAAHTFFLSALDLAAGGARELVVVGPRHSPETGGLLDVARERYDPNLVLVHYDPLHPVPIATLAPYVRSLAGEDDRPTAYLCHEFQCERPVRSPEELRALLHT